MPTTKIVDLTSVDSDHPEIMKLSHRVDKLHDKVAILHDNHTEHKKELTDLSDAVNKLNNTINRAIWILVGAAAVIAFLSSGQFTQTVQTGSAIVGSQSK